MWCNFGGIDVVYLRCFIMVQEYELPVNLLLLEMYDTDVIFDNEMVS